MIKKIAILILCLNISNIKSQDQDTGFDGKKWIAPYSLPVYEGWDLERFQIPISFAPKIPYKGVEDKDLPRVGPKKQVRNIGLMLFYGI